MTELFGGEIWAATSEHAEISARLMLIQMLAEATDKPVPSPLNETEFGDRWNHFIKLSKDSAANETESVDQGELQFMKALRNHEVGIFCPNESTTVGMYNALKDAELLGVVFVGFDISQDLFAGVHRQEISGLVIQDAREIGRRATEFAVMYLLNPDIELVGKVIDPVISVELTNDSISDESVLRLVESYGIDTKL